MPETFNVAERKLWLQWVAAAVVGPAFATLFIQLISANLPNLAENQAFFFVLLIAPALPQTLIEWYAVHPHVDRAWWWIPASLFGNAISPITVNLLQWFALRKWVQRALWWPIVGYLLWFGGTLYVAQFPGNQFALIGLWLIKGMVSGWLMVILLRKPLDPGDRNEFDALIRAIEERQKKREKK